MPGRILHVINATVYIMYANSALFSGPSHHPVLMLALCKLNGEGLGDLVTYMMIGGRYPMKNLQTIPVISYPRTQDRNIQKTTSIQLVLWCTDSRLIPLLGQSFPFPVELLFTLLSHSQSSNTAIVTCCTSS